MITMDVGDPPQHTEAWLDAFEEALQAEQFFERLIRFAQWRAAYVRHFRNVDEDYAAQLVADVIDDAFEGVIDWDPNEIDLYPFLRREIRSRIRHAAKRAGRIHYENVHDRKNEKDRAFATTETSAFEQLALREHAARVMAALRTLAAEDDHVRQLLDAFEQQVTRRASVIALTKLTLRQYEAARERLTRLTHHLPPELQP